MNAVSKGMMALALAAGPMAAQAQTYYLDIKMSGIQATPTTFMGSFTFNAGGTCFGSAAFCPVGTTPEISNVRISDPLSIDPPGGAFAFTAATGGVGGLSFYDTYFGTAGSSSFVYTLSFNLKDPLGGAKKGIGISDVVFSTAPNATGTFACGGPKQSNSTRVTCTKSTLTKAPEIDPASAAGGLALLLGGLAVLRGRRPAKRDQ